MRDWSILMVEGAHEREFVIAIAVRFINWHIINSDNSPSIPQSFRRGKQGKYSFLSCGSRKLIIANLEGLNNILGGDGKTLATLCKHAHAVGVILDADDHGVSQRQTQVREQFGPILSAAANVNVGEVATSQGDESTPRFGLWVAPDCINFGQIDDLILSATREVHGELTALAESFILELGAAANHSWGQYKKKATLGALSQRWKAGASLATSMSDHSNWIPLNCQPIPACQAICDFLRQLV